MAPSADDWLRELRDGNGRKACVALSEMAHQCFGKDAAAFAATLRPSIGVLVKQMQVSPHAMLLLGNLLTDAFDPEAKLSLVPFKEAGGLEVLQEQVASGKVQYQLLARLPGSKAPPHGCGWSADVVFDCTHAAALRPSACRRRRC